VDAREPLRRARQVELDDLGGAGAHEEEEPDVGAPLQQPADDAVEFLVRVGEAGEVALFHDRGGEARLGEDHHAGGGLDQVRAGARSHDEEEGVLDLAVQPDDAGEAAEDLALAALAQDERLAAAAGLGGGRAQPASPRAAPGSAGLPAGRSRRAVRSFRTNCAALTT
jgi:hypothetical protein